MGDNINNNRQNNGSCMTCIIFLAYRILPWDIENGGQLVIFPFNFRSSIADVLENLGTSLQELRRTRVTSVTLLRSFGIGI